MSTVNFHLPQHILWLQSSPWGMFLLQMLSAIFHPLFWHLLLALYYWRVLTNFHFLVGYRSGVVGYSLHYLKNSWQWQTRVKSELTERSQFPRCLPNDGNMYRQSWQTGYLNSYKNCSSSRHLWVYSLDESIVYILAIFWV